MDLVVSKGIKPFTQYAKDTWPFKPEEFYAEAYSIWVTVPTFLKDHYKDVFDFFDGGEYKK